MADSYPSAAPAPRSSRRAAERPEVQARGVAAAGDAQQAAVLASRPARSWWPADVPRGQLALHLSSGTAMTLMQWALAARSWHAARDDAAWLMMLVLAILKSMALVLVLRWPGEYWEHQ